MTCKQCGLEKLGRLTDRQVDDIEGAAHLLIGYRLISSRRYKMIIKWLTSKSDARYGR